MSVRSNAVSRPPSASAFTGHRAVARPCCCVPLPTSIRTRARRRSMVPDVRRCHPRNGGARWPWWWPRASGGRARPRALRARGQPGLARTAWPARCRDRLAGCPLFDRRKTATGLAADPDAAPGRLLLDEPTGNLDQDSTRRVEALLDDYRQQQQAALLWVTHDPEQIRRVARRSFALRNGLLEEDLPR